MKINECLIGQLIVKENSKDVLITSANVVFNEVVLVYNFTKSNVEAIPWNTEVHVLTKDFTIRERNSVKVKDSRIDN